jgi:DNA-binding NtrC family response regulator
MPSHQPSNAEPQRAAEPSAAPPRLPTVLIVEDEGVSRNALRKLLLAQGYEACAYECAEDALAAMADRTMPPVALIDVDLPGMSGLDFATRLEQLRPDMVKVLITAAAGDRIESYRRVHEVHYIRKPLDFGRLLRLLGETPMPPRADC